MKFYRQKVELIAGNKRFTNDDFEIDFRVEFGDTSEPNISEVIIYNLSKNTIDSIKSKDYVILNCGYGLNVGNILTGKIKRVYPYWEGVDKVIKLYVIDGPLSISGSINITYKAGTTSTYIINDLAKIIGLQVGEIKPSKNITYSKGRVFIGSPMSALKSIVKETSSKMYINKGRLFVRALDIGTKIGFLLNSNTGLIESPTMIVEEDKKRKEVIKYSVKSLLNYEITTDSIIKIESKTINGNYRVKKGTHFGDFITEFEVVGV